MIEAHNLSKYFGSTKAVNNISFRVDMGETLVLLGTSGCGKTTTLKMINRLIAPDSGTISVNGKDIKTETPETLRRGIGYVLQNNGLFPHYTVAENIAVVPRLLQWGKAKIDTRTAQLLEKLHLTAAFLNKYPHQLSGGQQQRVGLARALAANPPVLLMDEPFGALDNITRTKIQAEFKNLDELKNKTIVMVTHDVQEAFALGNRIAIMHKGEIVQHDTPAGLLHKPKNAFVKDFLKEQAFQLELKNTCMADIWPYISNAGNTPALQALHQTASVWQALEYFNSDEKPVQIVSQLNKDILSPADIITAFYQYKKQKA